MVTMGNAIQVPFMVIRTLQAVQSTMHAEMRYLVRPHRAMRSRRAQAFAREMIQRHRHLIQVLERRPTNVQCT